MIIHAPNIHFGGGRVLLLALLQALKSPAVVQLDERFEPLPELPSGVTAIRVAPTLIARLQAEYRLRQLCRSGDTLLCFGNLPPLFSNPARIFVYLQNRYLIGSRTSVGLPWLARFRIRIERLWLRCCLRNAIPLVQTETMTQEVREHLGREAVILPFCPEMPQPQQDIHGERYDYLYVASGEPHKNHRRLVQAWVLLADRGFKPSLCLTLDKKRDAELCAWVEQLTRRHGLRIANNPVTSEQVMGLYAQCGALIYPSLFESFGLPLLEARRAGVPIVAAECDYVRDVVTPLVSFDPESVLSIARAVIRHQGIEQGPDMPVNAATFLHRLAELG